MERKHTISILVENEFGVLARVAGLFSSKGYNIDSLSVSETMDPSLSRMTIVTHGSDQIVAQIIKQLNKLVNTIKVEDLTREKHITREMCLIKLGTQKSQKEALMKVAERHQAVLLESSADTFILQLTGDAEEVGIAIEALRPFGTVEMEVVRTGTIAIQRGVQVLVNE